MADSEDPTIPKTLITLELETGQREFKSIEELQKWVSQEREFFSWMQTGAKNDGNCAPLWNVLDKWLISVNDFVNRYRQHENNPAQLQNITRTLHAQIDQPLKSGHLLTSKNPDAIFAKNLSAQEDAVTACYAAIHLLGININPSSNHKMLKGAFYAFQYRQGSTSTVESQAESLRELSSEWNSRFNEEHLKLRSENEYLTKEIGDLRDQFSDLREEINSQKEEQVSSFNSQMEESEKKLSDIAHTYDEKLALQSSVKYWKGKRKVHTKVMLWVGVATVALSTLTGGGFIFASYQLLQVTLADVELWKPGVLLAISTFGIWITRLAAKIFISNLHLRTDADERVTMIQTYLALLREGSGPVEEDRQLILQTLFRPSSTGFIKDDGPSSFHDIVNNILSKR